MSIKIIVGFVLIILLIIIIGSYYYSNVQNYYNIVCTGNNVPIDGICVECPFNSYNFASGVNTSITGCYCQETYIYDPITNTCNCGVLEEHRDTETGKLFCIPPPCVNGSSTTGTGPITRSSYCNCIDTTYYYDEDYEICIKCLGESLPAYTGTTVTANTERCYCPIDKGYNEKSEYCVDCIGGSSTRYNGSKTDIKGCNCPEGYIYDSDTQKCVICPFGTSTSYDYGGGEIINSYTGCNEDNIVHKGCRCPTNSAFDVTTATCKECLGGSSPIGSGEEANIPTCKCNYNRYYINGQCTLCPKETSKYYTGNESTTPGCYFPLTPLNCQTGYGLDSSLTCVKCVRGSSNQYLGEEANAIGCNCPKGYKYDSTSEKCITCSMGASTLFDGTETNYSFCKCPKGYEYSLSYNKCQSICNTGSSPFYTGIQTSQTGCFCPTGYIYNEGSCKQCTSGFASYFTGQESSTELGCYCPTGYEYFLLDETCIACPKGSSVSYTGPSTNVPNCNCLSGDEFDTNMEECIPIV